jgi:hypothetical protein
MVVAWTVDFYEEDDHAVPVEEFLSNLSPGHRAKAIAIIRLLQEQGPTLPFPYSSQVRGDLRELRTQYGKDRLRILYFGDPKRALVLLHGIIKRTKKLDKADIATAEKRMRRHLHRLKGGNQ